MALSVPLSRFTSRVGGGSAFFVRHHAHVMKKPTRSFLIAVPVVILVGVLFLIWHSRTQPRFAGVVLRVPPIIDTFGETNSHVTVLHTNGR